MLNYIILGMTRDAALTGYDIKKHIKNGIGTFYKASYGSLYPLLKKLAEEGYLIVSERPYGNRQKKYYQISAQGESAFYQWLSASMDLNNNIENHLAKVYFFDRLPADIRNRQLQEYEINSINYLRKLYVLEKDYAAMENKECFYYKLSTLYYGIRILQDNIRWCRHIQKKMDLTDFIEEDFL